MGNETPEDCAVREIEEELGLEIDPDALVVLEQEDRDTHTVTFFKLELKSLAGLKKVGDEQEEIKVFTLKDLGSLADLFPNHKRVLARVF